MPCTACNGCGKIASDRNRTPWSVYESLPVKSAAKVLMGAVRPLTCQSCGGNGGSGRSPIKRLSDAVTRTLDVFDQVTTVEQSEALDELEAAARAMKADG